MLLFLYCINLIYFGLIILCYNNLILPYSLKEKGKICTFYMMCYGSQKQQITI